MEEIFLKELNFQCWYKTWSGYIKWESEDFGYIKEGEGRPYCCIFHGKYELCDSCKKLKIQIRNFYSDVDINELNDKLLELQNKFEMLAPNKVS